MGAHARKRLLPPAHRDALAIALLVAFLFAHEFQPSQPFLVPYWKKVQHIPVQRIFSDIFPWATYAMLFMGAAAAASLWVLGLRPTLFLSGLAACAQTCFSLWGDGGSRFWMLILSEVTWAFGFGSLFVVLVAKFTLVPRRYFHTVSSLNKGASMTAVLLSSLLGQLITTFYLTIGFTALATVLVFFIPKPHSVPHPPGQTLRGVLAAYKTERGSTVMWALCYMVVQADSFLLVTYWQTLFNQIDSKRSINGYIFAAARMCGAASSLLPAFFQLIGFHSWKSYSTLLCMVLCGVGGTTVILLTYSTSLAMAMPLFCLQHACTEITEVICLAQVAIGVEKTPSAEYGWVFGVNYFLSISMQVIMQLVIQHLTIKRGYRVLAGILLFQMVMFMAFAVVVESAVNVEHRAAQAHEAPFDLVKKCVQNTMRSQKVVLPDGKKTNEIDKPPDKAPAYWTRQFAEVFVYYKVAQSLCRKIYSNRHNDFFDKVVLQLDDAIARPVPVPNQPHPLLVDNQYPNSIKIVTGSVIATFSGQINVRYGPYTRDVPPEFSLFHVVPEKRTKVATLDSPASIPLSGIIYVSSTGKTTNSMKQFHHRSQRTAAAP
eukprot:m51a1_g12134 hypothetical protein (601) ;mRNA; f:66-7018